MREIVFRLAQPLDMPAISAFHAAQNKRDGTCYPLPQLFDETGHLARNIAVAIVGERGGEVVQCFYTELVAELCFAGLDPRATAHSQREIERLAYLLRGQGITSLQCLVPSQVADSISKPLTRAGFKPTTGKLQHFFRDLSEDPTDE